MWIARMAIIAVLWKFASIFSFLFCRPKLIHSIWLIEVGIRRVCHKLIYLSHAIYRKILNSWRDSMWPPTWKTHYLPLTRRWYGRGEQRHAISCRRLEGFHFLLYIARDSKKPPLTLAICQWRWSRRGLSRLTILKSCWAISSKRHVVSRELWRSRISYRSERHVY